MVGLNVGFDIGPLHGDKTGIGFAVEAIRDALLRGGDVQLHDYLVSFRSRTEATTHRLPIPAALAHRLWAVGSWPAADRWPGGQWMKEMSVMHGTNYVVPPTTVPRLVSVYDCWFLRHADQARPAVARTGRVLRRAVAAGAVVHTSSHATARAVRELLPGSRVVTVHLGALALPKPPTRAPIGDLDGAPFILALGTLERRKNLPTLVQAFGRLIGDMPDLRLVLAGAAGDDRAAIEAATDALGTASNRVSFTGRVDDQVRSWLLHNAEVLAYPSLDEGFGFPLLDAMQAGVPIVASNVGSIPEIGGDAVLMCPPADASALAANLRCALTDSTVRARLVSAGDARWREFTWEQCAEQLADVYRRLARADPTLGEPDRGEQAVAL
ncbi:MAG: glycosyltransferase family 4 protein [Actinobacteria bacterium]|nr:glycosyltransferase family 4 protein [Actinomycetota bacterium]